jgi:serine/threonine-protein kinase
MAAQDPFVGKTLGRFAIEKKLGQGGMGAVYKAKDNLGRTVALKLLPAHFAAQPEWVERFRREASRAALLSHPNIVPVFESDVVEGHHYISMQFMAGGSLEGLLQRRGALPPAEAARIVRDAARGLACAHQEGVIHRDIKPANILLGKDDEVRLGDFGLVKSVKGDDQPITQTGMVLGTPHYMAPEQCEGLPDVDGRVDLYALGLVLYQALSNVLPAKGSTPLQIIRYRIEEDPPPLRQVAPQVPEALTSIVDALLVRDPAGRLSSASELVARLDAFLTSASAPGGGLSIGATPTGAAGRSGQPTIDITVPTGRLVSPVRRDEPEVLPDLGPTRTKKPTAAVLAQAGFEPVGDAPPRVVVTKASGGGPGPTAHAEAPRPRPPRRRSWACWFMGCGLIGAVSACFIGAAVAQLAEERERERRAQEEFEQQFRREQQKPAPYAPYVEEEDGPLFVDEDGDGVIDHPGKSQDPPAPPEKGKRPW